MLDRRNMLASLGAAALLPSIDPLRAAAPRRGPTALLVPLTGERAAIGLAMQRAAALMQAPADPAAAAAAAASTEPPFSVLDTAPGAAAAAQAALRARAPLILGPLAAAEVRPVLAAAGGRVPVLTFSNDENLRDSGAFLMGITASQSIGTILGYARGRGIRRVAIVQAEGDWAMRGLPVAQAIAAEQGLAVTVIATPARAPEADALLSLEGGAAFAAAATAIAGSGVQLLGTVQAVAVPAAEAPGAWIAAPDPRAFTSFARDYEARMGGRPGLLAALAYDAAAIARTLRQRDQLTRAGLLGPQGFTGITGAIRFREDGSAQRRLAVLVAGADGWAAAPQ